MKRSLTDKLKNILDIGHFLIFLFFTFIFFMLLIGFPILNEKEIQKKTLGRDGKYPKNTWVVLDKTEGQGYIFFHTNVKWISEDMGHVWITGSFRDYDSLSDKERKERKRFFVEEVGILPYLAETVSYKLDSYYTLECVNLKEKTIKPIMTIYCDVDDRVLARKIWFSEPRKVPFYDFVSLDKKLINALIKLKKGK